MLTIERIKECVNSGITVYVGNPRYRVTKSATARGEDNAWFVQCDNGSMIGLYGASMERPNVNLAECFLGVRTAVVCLGLDGKTEMLLFNLWLTEEQLADVCDHAGHAATRRGLPPLVHGRMRGLEVSYRATVIDCRDPAFRRLRPDLPFESLDRRGKTPVDD